MREIKFRAWDKQNKKYGAESYVIFMADGTLSYSSRIILEQYTGLKDKSGKEIYEGDRLGLKDPEDNSIFTVTYVDGGFRKAYDGWDKTLEYNHIEPFDLTMFEIIGNIHEVEKC